MDRRDLVGPRAMMMQAVTSTDYQCKGCGRFLAEVQAAAGVRLLALAHGAPQTGTLARIAALRERGVLGGDEAERLEGAFALLTRLRVRAQLADHRAGRPVGNRVDTRRLRALDRDALKAALATVNDFRARVRAEVTGALLA